MSVAASARTASRPSIMSLSIKDRGTLYAAYMPFVKNGGLFVPTPKPYALGDDVYLLLALMDDPTKFPIAGKVVWITPDGTPTGKPQGIGIQFPADESGDIVRKRIEELLAGALKSARPTHTL